MEKDSNDESESKSNDTNSDVESVSGTEASFSSSDHEEAKVEIGFNEAMQISILKGLPIEKDQIKKLISEVGRRPQQPPLFQDEWNMVGVQN